MMQQYRLADAARTHEDHGATDVGLFHELFEAFEICAPLHARIVFAYPGTIPPRIFGAHTAAHLFFRDPAHMQRLPVRTAGDQLEKVFFA